jgi:hypothetical protein
MGQQGAPGSIAHHLQAAGQAHAAARWQLQAAQAARARWLMADAAAGFEAAARALDQPGDRPEAFRAWREAARCWLWANREAAARAALDQAAPLVRSAADQALWRSPHAAWLFNTRQLGEAAAQARLLIDELEAVAELVPPEELVHGVRTVNSVVPHGVDVGRALALAELAQARLGSRDGDALRLLHAVRGGLLHWALRPQEAAAELDAAWQLTADGSDPGQRVMLANQLMRVLHALGALPRAMQVARALLDDAAQLQLGLRFECDVMHVLAMLELASGQAAAGMARLQALLDRWRQVPQQPQMPQLAQLAQMAESAEAAGPLPDAFITALALAHIAVGRHAEAAAWLEQHPARGQAGFVLPDIAWTLTRVKLALARGEDPSPWLAQVPALDALPPALQLQCTVALATLQPPPLPVLQALATRLRALGMRGLQRVVESTAARAALAVQGHDQAAAHARAALALCDAVDGWVDEPASVWLAAAEVLQACGQPQEALAAGRTGARWVQAGSQQWASAAERAAWCTGNPVHHQLLARYSS